MEIKLPERNYFRIIMYVFFVLLFIFVSLKIFFEPIFDNMMDKIFSSHKAEKSQEIDFDTFSVAFPASVFKIDPFDYDYYGRQVLINIFDPIVRLDSNMRPTSCLASSYGLIDDLTWNFRLREGVKFHNGLDLGFEDIEKTFEIALRSDSLKGFLLSIDKIEKINDLEFNIITKFPDPLLLQKLSMIFIVPRNFSSDNPLVGTGPFVFDEIDSNKVILKKYMDFWCRMPEVSEYIVYFESDFERRMDLLIEEVVDLLAFIPHSAIILIQQYGFNIISLPSLEVQFLMFNFESDLFSDTNMRKVFSSLIDKKDLISRLSSNVFVSNQFVGSGVFGFNTDLSFEYLEDSEINEILAQFDGEIVLSFILSKSLNVLGDIVKNRLLEFGIIVNVRLVEDEEIFEVLKSSFSDLIFMSYKTDLGDSGQFLNSIIRSDAELNIFNYNNLELDELIDDSMTNTDVVERLNQLKEIMRILIEDEVVGIPLFEYETYYGYSKNIDYSPRLDGLIYARDIKINYDN